MLVDHGARHDVKEVTKQWIPQDAADFADSMGKPDNATFLRELSAAANAVHFAVKMKKKKAAADKAKGEGEAAGA